MTALFRYLFVYYARSHRYLAPLLAYVGPILFIYSEVPNPVMDSYAFTAMWTFVIAAWLSYGFIDLEHEAQRFVTIVHSRSVAKYEAAKFSLLGTITALLSILAVAFPILFDKFDRVPDAPEAGIALLAHLVLAWLGIACAAFFTERWAASRSLALLGLLLVLAISVGGKGLEEKLPEALRFAMWLVPPVFRISDLLVRFGEVPAGRIALLLGYSVVYLTALVAAYIRLSSRRLF